MGWASGFQAGTAMGKQWLDIYNQVKQAAEISQAQEEYKQDPTQSFSTKQGEQLRGLGSETVLDPTTGQYVPKYNVSYSPDAGGYEYAANKVGLLAQPPVGVQGEATPVPGAQQPSAYQSLTGAPMEAPVTGRSSTPGVSGLVRPEAYNYMGQRYDTAPTPEQRRMALDARIADIVTQQDPVRGAQMRSDIARNQLTQQQLAAGDIALRSAQRGESTQQTLDAELLEANKLQGADRETAVKTALQKAYPKEYAALETQFGDIGLKKIINEAAAHKATFDQAFSQGEPAMIALINKSNLGYQLEQDPHTGTIYNVQNGNRTSVFAKGDMQQRMATFAALGSPSNMLTHANNQIQAQFKQQQEWDRQFRSSQYQENIARQNVQMFDQRLSDLDKAFVPKDSQEYKDVMNARASALRQLQDATARTMALARQSFDTGEGGLTRTGGSGAVFRTNDAALSKFPVGHEMQFSDGSWGRKVGEDQWQRIDGPAAKGGATTAPPPAPAPAPAAAQPAPAAAQPSTVAKPAADTGKPLGKTPVSAPSAAAPGGSMPAPTGAEDRAVQQRIKESQDREKAAADKRFSDLRAKKARGEKLTTSEEAVLRRMEQIRGSGK